jgi:hypothetical protein
VNTNGVQHNAIRRRPIREAVERRGHVVKNLRDDTVAADDGIIRAGDEVIEGSEDLLSRVLGAVKHNGCRWALRDNLRNVGSDEVACGKESLDRHVAARGPNRTP